MSPNRYPRLKLPVTNCVALLCHDLPFALLFPSLGQSCLNLHVSVLLFRAAAVPEITEVPGGSSSRVETLTGPIGFTQPIFLSLSCVVRD